jgi:uncharacterized Fe-S cluster-containing protein
MSEKKRYKIQTACPQCGCSGVAHLSAEEIKAKYGDVPNVEMECGACTLKYTTDIKTACPEWDKECHL